MTLPVLPPTFSPASSISTCAPISSQYFLMRSATSRSLREWLSICTSSSSKFLIRSWLIILPPKAFQVRAILLHQDATRRAGFASEGGPEFDIGNPSPFGRGQGEGAAKNRKKFSSPFTTIRCTKTFSHYALTPALSQRERETQRHSSSC